MYDIHPISDKPILIEPNQQKPKPPSNWISRVAEAISVLVLMGVLGYLVIPLAFTNAAAECDYSGDLPIEPAFLPIYEQNCLTIGAPISRMGQENIEGIGPRTIQYFEGALLMTDLAGTLSAAEIYPLGNILAPENPQLASPSANLAFVQYWQESGDNSILGSQLTDLVEIDGVQLVYFENGALQWHELAQNATPYHLGRIQLYANHPQLMVNAVNIPDEERLFATFGDVPDYKVTMTLQHPVLYAGDQQVVTLEVTDSITNNPITGLNLVGTSYFEDLGTDLNETFVLEPANELGVYTAVVNLPTHPKGEGGRDIAVTVSILGGNAEEITTIKKFQSWW